uniref:Uncharacterized protein n=1 Tax=Arion vulgaris TaxID=1028688 RepID=A0A0B7BWH6_9EUPU
MAEGGELPEDVIGGEDQLLEKMADDVEEPQPEDGEAPDEDAVADEDEAED